MARGMNSAQIRVVRAGELDRQTSQTDNLPRRTGVDAPNLWMGRVVGEPKKSSGAHHHGEAETAGYILSGQTRIYYGEEYKEYVDLEAGDFIYVPPYVPHIEENLSEEPVVFITARNPSNIVVNIEADEQVEYTGTKQIKVIRAAELERQTAQTENLPRRTGVDAPNLWMGRVVGEPKKSSGAHHHGEAETAGYILSGQTRIYYGEEYKEYVDLNAGDFIYVPPYVPHIEENLSEEPVVFITARNPKNTVVNID